MRAIRSLGHCRWIQRNSPADRKAETEPTAWRELFRYPRSLAVFGLGSLGCQTGGYGLGLWSTTLLVQVLTISPSEASNLMIAVTGWRPLSGALCSASCPTRLDAAVGCLMSSGPPY